MMLEKDDNALRIVTLNTWKGDGPYNWRLQLMARELYSLMPDIICLQEAVRSEDGLIDTARFLAEFLGLHYVYAPSRKKVRTIESVEHLCCSGLAILTRYPVEKSWTDILHVVEEDPDRIALTAQMQTENCYLTITNLHLTHLPGADPHRLKQFTDIIQKNNDDAVTSHWFCCGDFNCAIDTERFQPFKDKHNVTLKDCYLLGGGDMLASTLVGHEDGNTQHRIDYLLYLERTEIDGITCNKGRIVLNEPDFEGCYPSDHFGVSADIFPQVTSA